MNRKKIDNRIRVLIENGIKSGHRSMFVIVGPKSRDQVVILHHMLSKALIKASSTVLWCSERKAEFSNHRKKKMKFINNKMKGGNANLNEEDPFEMFVASTKIRYCFYKNTHTILGNTYGMCILQDFERITPNLLARTIETVEGGGLVIFILDTIKCLDDLSTMNMNVHKKYQTEAHKSIECRFNRRFVLSLESCERCLVLDDQLNIIQLSSHNLEIEPVTKFVEDNPELIELKESLRDTQPVGKLIECCKTVDQAKALLKFVEGITEKSLKSTVSVTAARGRGKSATLGLAVAAAIAFNYRIICVTSPSPENLNTFFEFVFKGLDALDYQEHIDYKIVQSSNPELHKAILRVEIFKDNNSQTIQYLHPTDSKKLSLIDLLVIDEAAAIPLPLVKEMLGPYLVFLSSTVNGYEGTGRSLSLKLLQQLRAQANPFKKSEKSTVMSSGRSLHEIVLNESIRYKPNDSVEAWLINLLCLDSTSFDHSITRSPSPDLCNLYYIDLDTLFSYHKASELFLQKLFALFTSSHYKNSPDDLQMMSDAPAHHLFCLLGPINLDDNCVPEILVAIQICLEGNISRATISNGLAKNEKAAGDLIPWTISQKFHEPDFGKLCGARIIRIATHSSCQNMGYGKKAMQLLKEYFEFKYINIEEIENRENRENANKNPLEDTGLKKLPPLLSKLSERKPEKLDYLGVCYGMTEPLIKFWKRNKFVPLYIAQNTNDITGEHSCIMLSPVEHVFNDEDKAEKSMTHDWLQKLWWQFRGRFIFLLSGQFRNFSISLALHILYNDVFKESSIPDIKCSDICFDITKHDIVKRLKTYEDNDDLIPRIAKIFFYNNYEAVLKKNGENITNLQKSVLLAVGLQRKTHDELKVSLNLDYIQIKAQMNRFLRIVTKHLQKTIEEDIRQNLDLSEASNEFKLKKKNKKRQRQQSELENEKLIKIPKLEKYSLPQDDKEWAKVLDIGQNKDVVSIECGLKKVNVNKKTKTLINKQKHKRH